MARKKRTRKPAKVAKATPRVRKQKTIENDETCLQMHAWAWVKKAHPTLLIFHVANERKAAVQYHVKLKRLGVLSGVADFLAFPNGGRKIAIELKDDEGEQDVEQIQFELRWGRTGGTYVLVRTLADFQTVINGIMLFG